MFGMCLSYVIGALVYVRDGKPWMAATLFLYAASILTLYMAGEH